MSKTLAQTEIGATSSSPASGLVTSPIPCRALIGIFFQHLHFVIRYRDLMFVMAWHGKWRRALGEVAKVPDNRLLIALRGELGEEHGRFHFHALVGGTTARNMTTFCHQAFWHWRRIAGCPRTEVRPYIRSLAGADYICKCLGANAYEVGKFNWADQVTLSRSVFTLVRVQERRCQAQARRLERDAAANTLGKDSGAMSPACATNDTARFAATSAAITQNTAI